MTETATRARMIALQMRPAMTDTAPPPLKTCPACNGRGYLRCECWPCDCICGWGDETCEECGGHGVIDPTYDEDYHD